MPTQNFLKLNNLFKFFIIFFILSCSFRNESLKRFFSDPSFERNNSEKNTEQVLILSTNGFLGQLESLEEIFPGLPPIKVGGKDVFTSYIDITREKYPNVLFLDGGNILDPKTSDLSKTLEFYSTLGLDGVALTDSDLNYLKDPILENKLPFINSNFMDLKSGKPFEMKGLSKSKIFEKGKIRIVVYSVIEPHSYSNLIEGIYVKDPIFSLLKEKEANEEEEEIHLNVLLVSLKTGCYSESPLEKKSFKDSENFQLICPKNDELFKLISRLPPNFINLIILNNNFFADGFIGQIPVIQNPGKGKYLSRINITYDLLKKRIVTDKSEILPPLKTCHRFFASTEDCHLGKQEMSINEKKRIDLILESGNKMVPAFYLGEKLQNWSNSITN
ncbi:MAG: hypothetical protein ACHQYQ_00740 [Bacteriovoracales bacterium]|jgi:2',3'-cyclic-nucleotide 2'-phosphodiesterase (5'-nucleotidase family)